MAQIFCQRDGPAFPLRYKRGGTTRSSADIYASIPIRYSVTDPTVVAPADDLIPKATKVVKVFDPATYAGEAASALLDTRATKWQVLTYAGSNLLFAMRMADIDDVDTWLTQPDKLLPTVPPTLIAAPYGTDEKFWVKLWQMLPTHPIDREQG